MVDSQGRVFQASATSEVDIDWACKGGGGGSFGIATEFKLRVFPLKTVLVFGVTWTLSQAHAAKMFAAWQAFAPNAPSTITSIVKVQSAAGGMITVRCIGQSVGSEAELRAGLQPLLALDRPSTALSIKSLGFLDAVTHFAGTLDYESIYMKAKSDYVLGPLGADAIQHMIAAGRRRKRRRAIVRRLWRQDRGCRRRRHRLSQAQGHAVLHSILFELDACGGYGDPYREGRQGLCRDAAVHAGRVLCELLRSRSAQLRQRLLGRQPAATARSEGAIRPG